jgi:pimeloyl-ACP methyl ester carboxylesterase
VAPVLGGVLTDFLETRFARTAEGRVAYQVMGDGPIDIIVANAISPVDLLWDEPHLGALLTRLSSFSRHIWFDFYRVGASDWLPPAERRVFESNVNAMVAVLDDVGCDRAAVLSLHAHEGLLFAATHPQRRRALVVVNTFATLRRTDDQPEGWCDEVIDRRLATLDRPSLTIADPDFMAPSLAADERFVRWLGRAQRLPWHPADIPWLVERNLHVDLRPVLSAVRA